MDITYRIAAAPNIDGLILRAESAKDFCFDYAIYSQTGERIAGKAADEFFAVADAAAPAKAAEMFAARAAETSAKKRHEAATKGAIKARFDGVCAVTSRRFVRNSLIRNTNYGWAIADEITLNTLTAGTMGKDDPNWLGRQMDREDSMF